MFQGREKDVEDRISIEHIPFAIEIRARVGICHIEEVCLASCKFRKVEIST